LQWSLNQPIHAALGWWFTPFTTFFTGILLLIIPDAVPNIEMAPYPAISSWLIGLVVVQINLMKWDWYLTANLFNTFTMSQLDPINWGWPWVPLWLIFESVWILFWATPWAIGFNIWWSWPFAFLASFYTYSGSLSVPYFQFSSEDDDSSSSSSY
jgi:hypothetical protein